MTLLSPLFLWSLLALIPLAAIYFLKVRPRKRPTTAYFLWEKIFIEKKANSLLSKLRDLFSLLLMLAAFVAVVFALTRPSFDEDQRRDLLLMIDVSASMGTESSADTRLEEALSEARDIVRALNGNQRAAVVTVGEAVKFVSSFTESPRELLDAIDGVEGFPGALRVEALKEFLSGSDPWSDDLRVIFLTDGQYDRKAIELGERVEVLKIGGPADNVGLTLADLTRLPNGNLGFYYRVASSFKEPVQADLVLRHGGEEGQIFKLIPLRIEPGLNPSEFFEIEDGLPGRWIAEIDTDDSLKTDNRAWLAVSEERPIPVFVATDQRYFYETSILAFEEAGSPMTLVRNSSEAQVVIFEGEENAGLETMEGGLSIFFAPLGESALWSEVGDEVVVEFPRVKAENHPALKFINVESISFFGARDLSVPEEAQILVESESGVPLIYRLATPDRTAIVVNLDPIEAGFYFSAWFPTFLYSASIHLAGREIELASTNPVGAPVVFPGSREGEITTLQTPGDEVREVTGEGAEVFEETGFYVAENVDGVSTLGSSLLSLFDTSSDEEPIIDSTNDLAAGRGVSYWLLAMAILLLVSESLLYHRRKVG